MNWNNATPTKIGHSFTSYLNFIHINKKVPTNFFYPKRQETKSLIKAPKFQFSLLFVLVWLRYTKQAHYNEGCAKLNYLLPEV